MGGPHEPAVRAYKVSAPTARAYSGRITEPTAVGSGGRVDGRRRFRLLGADVDKWATADPFGGSMHKPTVVCPGGRQKGQIPNFF